MCVFSSVVLLVLAKLNWPILICNSDIQSIIYELTAFCLSHVSDVNTVLPLSCTNSKAIYI